MTRSAREIRLRTRTRHQLRTKDGRRRRLAAWLLLCTRVYAPGERAFLALTRKHFHRVFRDLAAYLEELRAADVVARISMSQIDVYLESKRKEWDAALAAMARPVYRRTAGSALAVLEAQTPAGFEVMTTSDPELLRFLHAKEIKLHQVDDTTIARVRQTLIEGLGEGETITEMRKRLQAEEQFSFSRARNIARTEVASASNGARYIGMQVEEVDGREWTTAGDDAVRESHVAMDGVVVPREGAYTLPTGVRLQYPGDPSGPPEEICQCRCSEGPVWL